MDSKIYFIISYKEAGYHCHKIKVNPLGVDLEKFSPKKPKQNSDLLCIAFVGQLSIQKGIPHLLQAWKELNPSTAQLVLAGIVPANEKGVISPLLSGSKNVEWRGHETNVSQLLHSCDVLVLPSAQDGFGLVVLEAFASGLPVLISDRVGARDCVVHGKNGWVFCFDSHDSLKAHLDWLIKHPDETRGMREIALQTAQNYTWEKYGERFVSLINDSSEKNKACV